MRTLHLRYFGNQFDNKGMPHPYFAYLVTALPLPILGADGAVATVTGLSAGTMNDSFAVKAGGVAAALAQAEGALDTHHRGLQKHSV